MDVSSGEDVVTLDDEEPAWPPALASQDQGEGKTDVTVEEEDSKVADQVSLFVLE